MKLYTRAMGRLRQYRETAAKSGKDWRDVRPKLAHWVGGYVDAFGGYTPASGVFRPSAGSWGEKGAYYCDNWPEGIRLLGSALTVCMGEASRRIEHGGWFTDDTQTGVIQGYVLQLPGRDGKPRYIAGIASTDSDGVTLWPREWYEEKLDAATAADRAAELAAESEREHNEVSGARFAFDEKGAEMAAERIERRELRAILARLKGERGLAARLARSSTNLKIHRSMELTRRLESQRAQLALDYDHREGWKQ